MATPIPQSAPARTPSITEQANQSIAAAKTGRDPLRPLRYAVAFMGGTIREGLNGIAAWGSKGLMAGLAVGILVGIGAPWLLPLGAIGTGMAGALGGFALGVAGGGIKGLATGGTQAVKRMNRAEKYAEDLIQRGDIQRRAPTNRADYRPTAQQRKEREFQIQRQFMERESEVERDARTYGTTTWQDRVSGSNNHQGLGL